jgi:phospholipid/cholesterol/gamma-HCH transport system permease protein
MTLTPTNNAAFLEYRDNQLKLGGEWTLHHLPPLERHMVRVLKERPTTLILDGSQISGMDTAGAWYLYHLIAAFEKRHIPVKIQGLKADQQKLLEIIGRFLKKVSWPELPARPNLLARVGIATMLRWEETCAWLAFQGEVFVYLWASIREPSRIRWAYFLNIIETNGYHALPIIGFLSFLIGVVLTYQTGLQLKIYGANIFIIPLLGIAVLREFGPLIAAIIVVGRTGAAYTAQLGLMKVNEEVDALRTMGHSPAEFLVIPRILGLLVALPLLTVWADIFGILGGMIMSKNLLSINYYDFLSRFPSEVTLTTFNIGLIKAPVFALIIALVGCYHGFQVAGSSESIGAHTTRSVVMATFLIIVADAIFSIVLSWLDI